jgi:hypothetical protein
MAIATIHASNRSYRVVPATANVPGFPFLEIGPAGTSSSVSVHMVQFSPSINFDGAFVVEGRVMGTASDSANVPFVPIPYRRVSLANVAQEYAIVTDAITGAATIQIPANGLSVVLQMSVPTQGYCDIVMWDLQGSSAI